MMNILIWLITLILFLIGLAGTIIPGLPGVGLVYAGVLVYAMATNFAAISLATVIVLGFITALALTASYIGSALGSRYAGGKKWAVVGATLGALAGTTLGPLGIFAGAFLGALVGALLEGSSQEKAVKVAFYATFGTVGSIAVQFLLAVILIMSFFIAVAG